MEMYAHKRVNIHIYVCIFVFVFPGLIYIISFKHCEANINKDSKFCQQIPAMSILFSYLKRFSCIHCMIYKDRFFFLKIYFVVLV